MRAGTEEFCPPMKEGSVNEVNGKCAQKMAAWTCGDEQRCPETRRVSQRARRAGEGGEAREHGFYQGGKKL